MLGPREGEMGRGGRGGGGRRGGGGMRRVGRGGRGGGFAGSVARRVVRRSVRRSVGRSFFGRYGAAAPLLAFIPAGPASPALAYALAVLPCFFGMAGLHRFYLGRPLSGALWFFTWGLCGLGTLFDLATMGTLIDAYDGYVDPEDAAAPAPAVAAAPSAAPAPQVVVRETIREIVKIKCQYCGTLMDHKVDRCEGCGAPM